MIWWCNPTLAEMQHSEMKRALWTNFKKSTLNKFLRKHSEQILNFLLQQESLIYVPTSQSPPWTSCSKFIKKNLNDAIWGVVENLKSTLKAFPDFLMLEDYPRRPWLWFGSLISLVLTLRSQLKLRRLDGRIASMHHLNWLSTFCEEEHFLPRWLSLTVRKFDNQNSTG